MQPKDREEFLKVLNGLSALKGKSLAVEALDLWWMSMQKWELADFKAAAAHLVGSCQFMPTPYDFNQLKRAGEPTSGEAWEKAFAYCAHKRGPTPGGRIDRAALAVGGYYNMGMANIETAIPHIERRFKEAYEDLADVEEIREALPEITLHELQLRLGGEPSSRLRDNAVVPQLKHFTDD
jgi:hypothetical protein